MSAEEIVCMNISEKECVYDLVFVCVCVCCLKADTTIINFNIIIIMQARKTSYNNAEPC